MGDNLREDAADAEAGIETAQGILGNEANLAASDFPDLI
jgi:hypothetical protein